MKKKSTLSEDNNVPIICLDDDDDDVMIDRDYKLFFDHLRDDNNLNPNDSKRSKLENEKSMKNIVSQQSKKRETVGFKGEITREIIQRDNRAAQRREKRISEFESCTKDVPLVSSKGNIRRDNKVRNFLDLKAETLRDSLFVRTEEDIHRDNDVSEGRKRKAGELKAVTLRRSVPLVRTEDNIHRDNRIAERRIVETKDVSGASKVVHVELEDVNEASKVVHVKLKNVNEASKVVLVEPKDVNEASRMAQGMTQQDKGDFVRTMKKIEKENVVVIDKDYMSYLTWLVDSLEDSTTKQTTNLDKDMFGLDAPISDTLKESTTVLEREPVAKVKVEKDLDESLSDDSDIIMVSDSPFFDGEAIPFVSSKSKIVDLDKESISEEDETSSWFSKELMKDLKRPYNDREFSRLYREASIHRRMTRCRELRKGRESDYETDELGKSYFERFDDFHKAYKGLDRSDKARSLELLRGFFFYLKNVSHDGAFKPWMN
ncbi:unnamed protein product [Cochlearia groenlandica]